MSAAPVRSTRATWSLALGLLSFALLAPTALWPDHFVRPGGGVLGFVSFLLCAPAGLIAVVEGVRGLREVRRGAGQVKGGWPALAGVGAGLAGIALAVSFLLHAIDAVKEAAERSSCNLGGISLAIHNYNDEHGRLPPAVYDEYGTPLLSWRVLILPYIEHDHLYKEFRLDEPWDSEHNRKLLPRMPKPYAPPGRKADLIPPHHTVLHVFVGEGALFDGPEGPRLDDCADGLSNTLLFVEAGEPVPWTKPGHLAFDRNRPLPELRCLFKDGFRACTADGSYRWVPKGIEETALRALITRGGNDTPESRE